MKNRIARCLRTLADRLDQVGAPKRLHWSFTFESYSGIVFREDGKGCPLWYYGDADYVRAHDEADKPPVPGWAALFSGGEL